MVIQLSVHILHSIRHPLQLTCFVLGVKNRRNTLLLLANKNMASKYNQPRIQSTKTKQNCSFVATVPPRTRGDGTGAPLDHKGLGLTKPATFLVWGSGPPATIEHALNNTRRPSRCSQPYLPESLLIYTRDGILLVVCMSFYLLNPLLHSVPNMGHLLWR